MIAQQLNPRLALVVFVSLLFTACGSDNAENLLSSAKEYLAKNDSKAAVIQIKNALQKKPDSPEARYLLGRALSEGGDPVGAEVELRKALEFKHDPDLVAPLLAKVLLTQGQFKKLTDELSGVELGQSAAKADLQTTLASAYAAQGKGELFQSALKAALSVEPGYGPALLAQARYLAGQRDFDGAMAMIEQVIAKSPSNHEAWKLKGDIFIFLKKRPVEALEAYQKALAIKPDFLPAHFGVLGILLQQGKLEDAVKQLAELKKSAANHPQTTYFEAQLAYQQRDFKLARELSQQLLRSAAVGPNVLQLAGAAEFQLNSLAQAEEYLSRAIQAAPELSLARRLLITTYLRTGQAAKALAALPAGLSPNDPDSSMLSVAGQVYLQNGDAKKAEEYFAHAVKLDPKDSAKRTSLAMTHLMKGEVDSAFGELQDISASDNATTADLALISAYLRRSQFDRALKAIDSLEKKQPTNPLPAHLRGGIHLARQDKASAKKSFEQALAIDPMYFPAVVSLAALDMAEKKPEEAKKRFDAVLLKDPKHVQALLALAELRARAGAGVDEVAELIGKAVAANPNEISPRLLLIDFHLRNKDLKQATAVAQNAVAALPDSPELLDAMGRVQLASGEVNQAIASYNKLAGLQPRSPLPHIRLAAVHMAAKNKEAAISSLGKALAIKPDLLEAQRGLILLNLDMHKYQDALTIARTVQKQRPKEAVGFALEGDIGGVQKKWESAAAAYRAGLKQVPASDLAVRLHSALLVSGKTAEAEKFSRGWTKDHPTDAAFTIHLADAALARGDLKTAEKHYMATVGLQPNNALAFNNLAWVMGKLNKEGAIAYAENANKLMPNQPAFMDTLAMLLSDKGDYQKAVELENKAIALQPQNALFKLNLAKIHIKGEQKDLARKELDDLAKLGEKFPAQAEVRRLLATL